MICFSGCKINLGLHVTRRRDDGYHDIETLMYPVAGLHDIVEIVPGRCRTTSLSQSGIIINCATDSNICIKTYNALKKVFDLPPVDMHLHKSIPFGAGLGGGSANGAYVGVALYV